MGFQVFLIVVGSLFLVFVSKRSLKNIQAHGFYRFFAFEFTFICLVINLPVWFKDPFACHQLISWLLLVSSLYLALAGIYLLKKSGHPGKSREDSTNYDFENTSRLVKTGPYRFIRHPMYASLLFLVWGAALKSISPWSIILAVAATLFLYLTSRVEEKENIRFFGNEYQQYIKETKMLIPFVW